MARADTTRDVDHHDPYLTPPRKRQSHFSFLSLALGWEIVEPPPLVWARTHPEGADQPRPRGLPTAPLGWSSMEAKKERERSIRATTSGENTILVVDSSLQGTFETAVAYGQTDQSE